MSAYIVDDGHIDYLIQAGLFWSSKAGPLGWYHGGTWHELTRRTAHRIGSILLRENFKSVNHRYGENSESPAYFYKPHPAYPPDPVQVLKAITCYEYQACEYEEWEASEAHAFCKALQARAIRQLPGWEEADWGAPSLERRTR